MLSGQLISYIYSTVITTGIYRGNIQIYNIIRCGGGISKRIYYGGIEPEAVSLTNLTEFVVDLTPEKSMTTSKSCGDVLLFGRNSNGFRPNDSSVTDIDFSVVVGVYLLM